MNKKNNMPWLAEYPPHIDAATRARFNPVLQPVHLLFENTAVRTPDAPALSFMGRTQTYAELNDTVQHLACGLQKMGVKKGDRVALVLPNTPYYVAAYYAALKVGAAVVNTNPLYTEDELQHIFKDSKPKLIFTLDIKSIAPKVVAACPKKTRIILCPLAAALPTIKRGLFTVFKRREVYKNRHLGVFDDVLQNTGTPKTVVIKPEEDVALLQYTGGTTGRPKGAMLTHANITAQTAQVATWLGPRENDAAHVYAAVIPFFHVLAMTACLNLPISTGAHIVMLPRFEMVPLLKLIMQYKVTIFPAVPTLFKAINHYPRLKKYVLTSLEFCISGGAPLPARTKHNFEALTGATLVEGYGLTEASPVLACNPPHKVGPEVSIGLPLPGTKLSIRDPENTKKEMKLGDIGEICGQGPQVMKGYWQNEAATKETIQHGWLKTGDLGRTDKAGYFYITDRLKDVILVNGYNVYPTQIETALYKLDAVADALVIGKPDGKKGEAPHAYVVLKAGVDVAENDILDRLKQHLNPLERPVAVHFRDELPKTLIGKPCRKTLREEELAKTPTHK